ncbi:hypothetical protein MAR_030929 [Mya arenaria]|uniref:Uncharacterized protein n=1 Tax=Mya arenaria TaxID=6604 RepID=A0ABY7F2E0_MYAAR|nr:hypothetical protein MAR_030929 [Mya arenaria]
MTDSDFAYFRVLQPTITPSVVYKVCNRTDHRNMMHAIAKIWCRKNKWTDLLVCERCHLQISDTIVHVISECELSALLRSQLLSDRSSFVSETCSNGTYQLDIGVDNSENGGSSRSYDHYCLPVIHDVKTKESASPTTRNAPAETLFSAESSRMDVVPGSFGNFTSGVINENGSVLGSSRFACMQVRCPSASLEGIPFDVRVTVTASMSICKLSTSALSGDAYSVERLVDGDVAHIDLQNGDNYGSKFGVYMSSGTRKKALYLAREACCSGNEFVITDIAPDMGVALHYTCA